MPTHRNPPLSVRSPRHSGQTAARFFLTAITANAVSAMMRIIISAAAARKDGGQTRGFINASRQNAAGKIKSPLQLCGSAFALAASHFSRRLSDGVLARTRTKAVSPDSALAGHHAKLIFQPIQNVTGLFRIIFIRLLFQSADGDVRVHRIVHQRQQCPDRHH